MSGLQTVDTVSLVAGNTVLVKNQTNAADNGIYVVSSGPWTRSIGADTWDEYVGAIIFIVSGTQADSAWYSTAQPGGTLGVTAINWSNFTVSAIYTAGTGLTLTGTIFSITPVGTAGTYGSASAVPVFVTNASGQVSSVTNTPIAIANTQVSGLGTMSTQNAGAVAITGSLTTTGAITAQTLNVQQVTSSIVYSSGSNIFGNSVSNTQSMTGSVGISGSLAVTGASTITDVLTLNSTISNGTYTYTLPSATGTLALTSALSGYVPYTGATQTLAMGTNNGITLTDTGSNVSISITSSSTATGAIYVNKSGAGTGIQVANNGTGFGFYANNISTGYGLAIGNSSTGKGLYIDNAAAATGDPFVYTLGGAAFVKAKIDYLGNITGVAATLTGALSGTSATFSASTNALNIGNSQNSAIALSTFGKTSTSGYATANNYLQIGAGENATSSTRLIGFGYSITANTNQPTYIGYIETSNTDNTKGSLIFGTRDVTTDTAPTTRLTITSGGSAIFQGCIGICNGGAINMTIPNGNNGGAIRMVCCTGANEGDMYFTGGGGTGILIAGSGKIGIGIVSPTEKLHLKDSTTGYVGLRLEGTGTYAGTDWTMYASSTNPSTADDFLGFYNNSTTDGATGGYKMSISKNGNVGINNTTTPCGRLQITLGTVAGGCFRTAAGGEAALTIEACGNSYMQFMNCSNAQTGLMFGNNCTAYSGMIWYRHDSKQLMLGAGGTETMYICGGNVGIAMSTPSQKLHVVGGFLQTAGNSSWYRNVFEVNPTSWASVVGFSPQSGTQYTYGYINITASAYTNGTSAGGVTTSRWYYSITNNSISVSVNGSDITTGSQAPGVRLTVSSGTIYAQVQSCNGTSAAFTSVFVDAMLASGYINGTYWTIA